jgi:type I restriction enzyme S subunit
MATIKPIDISPKDLETVKNILEKHVPEYEVRAFGSRVTWTAKESSDLDLVVMTDKPLATMRLADLKEDFSESDLPFKVDVVDWAATKEGFKKIIEKQAVKIKLLPFFSEIRLGDVCEKIGSGATPRGGSGVYLDSGDISLIRSQNIYNDGFHRDGLAFISQEHADQLTNVEVKDGDVLLNITGDSVARCCQVPPDVLPARVNQHVAIIRPNEEKLQRNFLRYYMVSSVTQNKLLSMAAAGATRPALTKGMIEDLKILAPDTTTQQAIAHILGTLDDKIELNRKMNQSLEEIARALYKSWFVDFDPVKKKAVGEPTGLPVEIDRLFPEEFVENELGKIPKGWAARTINGVCDVTRGASPRPINDYMWGEIPWIKIADATAAEGYFVFFTKELLKKEGVSKSVLVHPGDLIMSNSASCGIPIFVQIQGCIHDGWLLFRNFKEITAGYLFHHLSSISAYLVHIADGSVQKNLNTQLVGTQPIVVPSPLLLNVFNQMNDSIIEQMLSYSKDILALSNVRDTLLPLLLSGKLPIKDAEKFLAKAGV